MAEPVDPSQRSDVASRLDASTRVPAACMLERDRIVRARIRALSPVLAALTVGWIVLDAAVLRPDAAAAIAALRVAIAGALLLLARTTDRLPAVVTLRVFVWVQALGFGAMQMVLRPIDVASEAGYGLFPFVIVAQLALFPATWPQTLRDALAPAASLALVLLWRGSPLGPGDWRDIWLLVLLAALAAWTAQAQLRLLVDLLGARREAAQDALTGLANRRTLDTRLALEHERVRRHGDPFSVLMLDLDLFKHVNDDYGHAAGDRVLAAAAGALADELRAIDLGARFGGEEFLAMLPETPLEDAQRVAERIRRRIGAMRTEHDGTRIPVTVSIGIAQLAEGESVANLLARADAALYEAKRGGRNRCVAAPAPVEA